MERAIQWIRADCMTARLGLRATFRQPERRPRVYFYTTSTDKYLQARYVFHRVGLLLRHFRSKSDPYHEAEGETTKVLLSNALREVRLSLGESSLFFVEDTSLKIDALSEGDLDVPGLYVKHWFANTSFEELDRELDARGGDRGATIRSDIALHVPGLIHPVFFHGEVRGSVATSEPDFDANPRYPWLTPDNFNGWFVPEEASKRLGEMSVEESLRYDFRVRALVEMLDRLEEYTAALNLPSAAYQRKSSQVVRGQVEMFPTANTAYLVVGPTCAGKTTFAERAETLHELTHIEASAIVRTFDEMRDGEAPAAYAKRVLSEYGADVVARRILDWYDGDELEKGFVISGFRTIEELIAFKEIKPEAQVLFVEASARIRLERYLQRLREGSPISMSDLEEIDAEQASFGLLAVASQLADLRVRNEDSLETYHHMIDSLIEAAGRSSVPNVTSGLSSAEVAERGQLERCLVILELAGRPLSTDEIEAKSALDGQRIRHNNANKVLKQYPALVDRLEGGANRLRYGIRSAGRAYLRYLEMSLPS